MTSQVVASPVKNDHPRTVLETAHVRRAAASNPVLSTVESSTELREWVLQQIPGTYIWSEDLHRIHRAPEKVLDALCNSNSHRIQKVEESVYCILDKGHVAELGFDHYLLPDAGVQRAGAGSGYYRATALNAMCWSWHPTRQTLISALNDVTTIEPFVTFKKSDNLRRRLLNPVEVSVLEAMLAVNDSCPHRDWDTRYEWFITGFSISRLAKNAFVRMPLLREVAEHETLRRPEAFWKEFDELSRACPDRLEAIDESRMDDLFVAV